MTCACILFWFIIAAVVFKIYLKLRIRRNGSYTCLVGKTAIVTGANTGIGYVTALDFASRGAKVILACRNQNRAEDAKIRIINESSNPNVIYKLLDLASLDSVRDFANDINATEERIDILVNNAGAGGLGDHYTKDGVQITLQVNHVAGFLLTHLLLDKLRKSAPSRIVNVSSVVAKYYNLDVENMNAFPTDTNSVFADSRMYGNSKVCNILFTTELAKKLKDTQVTVNALHPGAVKTEICRRIPGVYKTIADLIAIFCFKTAEEGAQTSIYVATSPQLEGMTGKLFDNCKEVDLYSTVQDASLAQTVWKKCEEFAKLKNNEKLK